MLGNSSSFTGCQRRCSQSPICVLFHLAITLFHSFWVMSCTNMHLRVAGHITMHLLAPVILLVTPVHFSRHGRKASTAQQGRMTRLRKRTTRRTPLCGWLIPDCLWSRLLADAFKSPLSGHTASFCLVRERLQHSTSFSSLAVAVLVEASMPHSVQL